MPKFAFKTKSGNYDSTGGTAIVNIDREAAKVKEAIRTAESKQKLCRMLINTVRYAAGVPALPATPNKEEKRWVRNII